MYRNPCKYDKNGVCTECGRPKGWRNHKIHRGRFWKPCPGKAAKKR